MFWSLYIRALIWTGSIIATAEWRNDKLFVHILFFPYVVLVLSLAFSLCTACTYALAIHSLFLMIFVCACVCKCMCVCCYSSILSKNLCVSSSRRSHQRWIWKPNLMWIIYNIRMKYGIRASQKINIYVWFLHPFNFNIIHQGYECIPASFLLFFH